MSYDEFSKQLEKIKFEFEKSHGKKLETIPELELVLQKRMMIPRKSGARSLKGII